MKYDKLISFISVLNILIFLILPTSMLIPLKLIMVVVFIFSFITWLLMKNNFINIKLLIFSTLIVILLLTSYLQNIFTGEFINTGFRFISNSFLILIYVAIYYHLIEKGILDINKIRNIVLLSASIYSFTKIIILLFLLKGHITHIKQIIPEVIYRDYGYFIRINLGNDSVILFSLLLVLPFANMKAFFLSIIVILFILTTSFTKYLLLSFIFAIVLLMVFYKKIDVYTLLFIVLVFATFLYFTPIYDIYIQRFLEFSSYNDKLYQVELFLNKISGSIYIFMFGKGIGSYIHDFIKNQRLPFIYEVQWLSLFYQLGFLRILFLALINIFFVYKLYRKGKYYTIITYTLWTFASFTNPYLLISSSFIIYVICIGVLFNNENLHPRYKRYSKQLRRF